MRDRLRRLRRETGAEGEASPAGGAGASADDHGALQRRGARPGAQQPGALAPEALAPEALAPEALAATSPDPPRDLVEAEGPAGTYVARTELLAVDARHGDWRLDEIDHVDARAFHHLTGDAALAELDLRGAVYLDTETTGLAGGAGTWVYMVGLGRFVGERFECWQGFLRGPHEERALLAEVARRIGEASAVVSFFGKSFDRHRLEDKMKGCGVSPPFSDRPHLDLGHPLKRLTRGAFPDGRLATLERELCGLGRVDDLPGSLAPAAWFDHLAGRAHRLEGVFRHNRDDVLSLVTLAAHLGRVHAETRVDGAVLSGPSDLRARALARGLEALGEREAALVWWARARERAPFTNREDGLAHAECLRKLKRTDEADAALRELLSGPEDACTAPALLAHAMLLEHGRRDLEGALQASRRAALLVPRFHQGAEARRLADDLVRRIERLAVRLSRT